MNHKFTLTDEELSVYKTYKELAVLWFDEVSQTWTPLDAVLEGNQLIVETNKTGLFTVGAIQ